MILSGQHLLDDFVRLEIPFQAHGSGETEAAVERAADLCGYAQGQAAIVGDKNGFYLEAVPEGFILMLNNRDVPGVVGAVGMLLGEAKINIAGLQLGREKVGGMALSLVHVDERIPANVMDRLRTLPLEFPKPDAEKKAAIERALKELRGEEGTKRD